MLTIYFLAIVDNWISVENIYLNKLNKFDSTRHALYDSVVMVIWSVLKNVEVEQ